MWQRIQSVFLGVAILALILGLFFYPIWIGSDKGVDYKLYAMHFMIKEQGLNGKLIMSSAVPYCITSILMVAAITILGMEFRRFDNRILQVKLGTLNSLILAGAMICEVIFSNQVAKAYPVEWKYDLSLYLTFVAIACNWLAVRFIRRDEKLVKDSDRLR